MISNNDMPRSDQLRRIDVGTRVWVHAQTTYAGATRYLGLVTEILHAHPEHGPDAGCISRENLRVVIAGSLVEPEVNWPTVVVPLWACTPVDP